MSVCRPGTVPVPVASGIDKHKVWYPTAQCMPTATAEADFVRPLPHGYLSFAQAMAADPSASTVPTIVTASGEPVKRLALPSLQAYCPPPSDRLFAIEHGATVNRYPVAWNSATYFEAHFTPASPVVGLGIQRGGLHLMWVATRGVEMLVSFSAGTSLQETLEASIAWTELVPAALRAGARGDLIGVSNEMEDTVWLRWDRVIVDSQYAWTPTVTDKGPLEPLESTQWMGIHAVAIDDAPVSTSDAPLSAPTTEPMTLGFALGANTSDPAPTNADRLDTRTGLPIRVLIGGGQDSVVAFSEDAAGGPLALWVDVV
ncbi:hypothetical protein BC828DRAFT_172280 [Blastocladiella britannica]|nr:hypothetical protein BC828DRAFT_172280 [Blastocladiella britannica]